MDTSLRNAHLRRGGRLAAAVLAGMLVASAFWAGAAFATHRFTDVGHNHPHIGGINWAADTGITVGCEDGTRFCPTDPVTRAQMATFMRRLAGDAPGVDPSVNAALLDGMTAEELMAGGGGEPGVSGWEIVTATETASVTFPSATVQCPEGKVQLGGGGWTNNIGFALHTSRPAGTGWLVVFVRISEEAPASATVTAYAMCAFVDSANGGGGGAQ